MLACKARYAGSTPARISMSGDIMTEEQFLSQKLKDNTDYELTSYDHALILDLGIEKYIYRKLTSKKFRKWAISEDREHLVRAAIHTCVSEERPLEIRLPFGGYKLWRLPSSPEVDWAEFFAISYYVRYVAPVLAAYKPGVHFVFASDDIIMERMNNIPAADTNAYFTSFAWLIEKFRPFFPANFTMEIRRIADLYEDKHLFKRELDYQILHVSDEYEKLPAQTRQEMHDASEFNVQLKGVRDLTLLDDAEKASFIDHAYVVHDAYRLLSRREDFNRGSDKIAVFPANNGKSIPLGTTKHSVVKFWMGVGALEEKGDQYKAQVFSLSQLDAKGKNYREVPVALFDAKNFNSIRVYSS